jgi:hypothetical protein
MQELRLPYRVEVSSPSVLRTSVSMFRTSNGSTSFVDVESNRWPCLLTM